MQWFDVDKEGLAKILERRGKAFVVYELIQNAWDQNVSLVKVELEPIKGRAACRLRVRDDDPEGFQDLSHAYTLFAESVKKGDPEKRGRFNLGEKLVLALCTKATIMTTKGSVIFDKEGRRKSRKKTKVGSEFDAEIRMTHAECAEICQDVNRLIVPDAFTTIFNGQTLRSRLPQVVFHEQLPTEIVDEEGRLKRTQRKTKVVVYNPVMGLKGWLYEMGIPVVETGDRFDVNVMQKIPVNLDRDNVSPSYLKAVRTFVLNHTYELLQTKEEATEGWVREALGDQRVEAGAFEKTTELRFGRKSVVYDPSDPEANGIAMSQGYNVIRGGSMSAGEWENNRRFETVPAAGRVTPSPKVLTSPNGKPWNVVDPSGYTPGMWKVVGLADRLAWKLLQKRIAIQIVDETREELGGDFRAVFGNGVLRLNVRSLGQNFFDHAEKRLVEVLGLLIHEFAHHFESNHLSSDYYRTLSRLGGELSVLALENPSLFELTE
jgi:hypothetical protein